jgi:hypothetical protein
VDYLEFLDLDDVTDGNKVNVLPNRTGDYFSKPIIAKTGIPIGAREKLTNYLYVSQYS